MLRRIQQLRYDVYCEEKEYLPTAEFEDRLEWDVYDEVASSFFAVSHEGDLRGTIRLIPPADLPLHALDYCRPDEELPPHAVMGEVSRLILPQHVRTSAWRDDFSVGRLDHEGREAGARLGAPPVEVVPEAWGAAACVLVGLFRAMYHQSQALGLRYWVAAMHPALARKLSRMGFGFRSVGPIDEAEGIGLYLAEIAEMEAKLARVHPAMLSWLQAES